MTDEPRVIAPVRADYGFNVKLGLGVFVNFGSTFVDTCPIFIGDRTLCGPNCSFYSGMHPLDPAVRMGITGPELGKPITIGEDCWLGGNVIILPGVTIGRGCSIGAGSVVTKASCIKHYGEHELTNLKDIPDFHVVVGNPARLIHKIETAMDPSQATTAVPANQTVKEGTERLLAEQ